MKIKNILYVASSSASRKMLLQASKIPFVVIGQAADESLVDNSLPLEDQVKFIAQLKMEHVQLDAGSYEDEIRFVLTADTMGCDGQENVHGKPIDREDAYRKIRLLTAGSYRTSTAFCIEKKRWQQNKWITDNVECHVVSTKYSFKIPENRIEDYFENSPALNVSGAIAVEEYGLQFLEKIEGSYTTIVGLPLFEVRTTLEKLGFFDKN